MLLGLVFFGSLGKVKLYQQGAVEGHTWSRKGLHTFPPTGGWLTFFFLNFSSFYVFLSFMLFALYLHLTAFVFGQQLADAYLPSTETRTRVQ